MSEDNNSDASFSNKGKYLNYPFHSGMDSVKYQIQKYLYKSYSRIARKSSTHMLRMDWSKIELNTERYIGEVSPESLILMVTTFNFSHEIAQFLDHYRKLGVDRFVFIDDGSDDGTVEYALQQPDIDLYTSNVPFGRGNDRVWRQMIVEKYGLDRWYLTVDSDEYLVYDQCERHGVRDLIQMLERSGEEHLLAFMVDIYPDGPLSSARALAVGEAPWNACPLFDSDGYYVRPLFRGITIRGGPRYRKFGFEGKLTKFPLIRADRRTLFDGNHHIVYPYSRNFAPIRAVLLHNKFSHQFQQRFSNFMSRKRHNNLEQFEKVMEYGADAETTLVYPGSVRYENSSQLVDLGLIEPSFD